MRKAMYLMGVLDDSDIEFLASQGREVRLPAGQALVREGVPLESLFLILDGRFGVVAGGTQVATLYSGEVIGEISFVDARPPLATVTALDASRVLSVPRDKLQRKLESDKKFAANFYRALALFLADRLRTTTVRLGYGSAAQDTGTEAEDDLGDELLETVSMGSRRFDELLRRVSR